MTLSHSENVSLPDTQGMKTVRVELENGRTVAVPQSLLSMVLLGKPLIRDSWETSLPDSVELSCATASP